MYRIIKHFLLSRRRLELFGEDHNISSGWLMIGKDLFSSKTVQLRNVSYTLPALSVSILPDCKKVSDGYRILFIDALLIDAPFFLPLSIDAFKVAGGDGTVSWVLGCLGELYNQGQDPIPPTAIIPLGTGNDLSKSFGWGGSFPFNWRATIKRTLDRVTHTPTNRFDNWRLSILMPAGEKLDAPHSLKQTEEVVFDQDIETDGKLPEKVSYYQGVFYNYFNIGMDAQVAYGFHHLRNEKPYLAHDLISNKMIYSRYSCKQGWFFTPCTSAAGLRGLKNISRLHVKRLNSSEWELVPIPSRLE